MQAGRLKHLVAIEKRDTGSSATDWFPVTEQPVRALVGTARDDGDFVRREVRMRWSAARSLVTGILELGYAYRFVWTNPQTTVRWNLEVESVMENPTERLYAAEVVFSCRSVQQRS